MEVSYLEGIANHNGLESCGAAREGGDEALTGERTGRVLSREMYALPRKRQVLRDADAVEKVGRQYLVRRQRFSVPVVHGTWKGTVSADGKTLTGTWDQGNPTPLVFTRDTFVPAAKPSRIDGIWLGALKAGGTSLRIQLHVKSDNKGQEFCSLDSLDQGSMGLDCGKVTFSGEDFSFDVPVVTGHYAGKLSADGNTLAGTWSQNSNSLPLTLARQEAEIAAKPLAPPKYDAAMAPVDADRLQAVLDPDLAGALKSSAEPRRFWPSARELTGIRTECSTLFSASAQSSFLT